MCGIAGTFRVGAGPDAVERMLQRMLHRGPDDGGTYADEDVSLGQRRLSIIDTSQGGHQPMLSADGRVVIVFNGEIYNFQSERARLEARGRRFRSSSDTEVILALYEESGERCLERLRGMFAIAIYDRGSRPGREKLLLARDHFGIKPLLYARSGTGLVFASELKAILASGLVAPEINPAAIRQLLSLGSIYQPQTIVAGVENLPPAHLLVADRDGIRVERYWSYGQDRIKGLRQAPYAEQVERVHDALRDSVRLQMVSDVSLGAFLSGGVDSSLIVALMSSLTNRPVKTFSVGFESGSAMVDETSEAAEMAELLATDHSRVVVTAKDVAEEFETFVSGLDQPSVDGLNAYFVSKAASEAVTVSLSGTGGDEVFLGYPWFGHIANRFGHEALTAGPPAPPTVFDRLRRLIREAPQLPPGGPDRSAEFQDAFGRLYHCFGPEAADHLLSEDLRTRAPIRNFPDDLAGSDELVTAEPLDRAGVLCLNGYTRNQLLRDIDACAMTHSLEVRVPFLDPVVADHALSLPTDTKLRMSERTLDPAAGYDASGVKRIVCDVARRYLPPHFFADRAKKGFNLPHAEWLRGPLAEILADTLSEETVRRRGLFDPAAVAALHRDFLEGRRSWNQPWIFMITELWHRQVLAIAR